MRKLLNAIFFLFLLFTIVKCDDRSEKQKLAHKVMQNTMTTLQKRYHLNPIGYGEKADGNHYHSMGVYFQIFRELSKEEGRKILIDSVQELLKEINSEPKLQPFLRPAPFTQLNIKLSIYVYHPDGKDIYFPGIGTFSFSNGKLHYKTEIPENIYQYHTQEEETYEEALKIVNSQRGNS